MKTRTWAARIGRAGLLVGVCALPVFITAGLARAQMVVLDAAPQDTTRARQT